MSKAEELLVSQGELCVIEFFSVFVRAERIFSTTGLQFALTLRLCNACCGKSTPFLVPALFKVLNAASYVRNCNFCENGLGILCIAFRLAQEQNIPVFGRFPGASGLQSTAI